MFVLKVVMTLGKNCHVLHAEFIKLLKDSGDEVSQNLIPHLGNSLMQLSKCGVMSPERDPTSVSIFLLISTIYIKYCVSHLVKWSQKIVTEKDHSV